MRPPATFHRVDSWLRELDLASNRHMKVVLIGNKCDLADGDSLVGMNRRQVSTQEARAYASGRGLLYEEASAKDGTTISHFLCKTPSVLFDLQRSFYVDVDVFLVVSTNYTGLLCDPRPRMV